MNKPIVINEEQFYKYCEDTKDLKNKLELGWLDLCKRIYQIKELGMSDISQYGSFQLFLAEIKLRPQTAIHMIAVYKRFCVEFGIEESLVVKAGGYTRAYELLPIAKNKESAVEALAMAEHAVSRTEIKEQVKETLTKENKEAEACTHEETVTIKFCKDCKIRLEVVKEN